MKKFLIFGTFICSAVIFGRTTQASDFEKLRKLLIDTGERVQNNFNKITYAKNGNATMDCADIENLLQYPNVCQTSDMIEAKKQISSDVQKINLILNVNFNSLLVRCKVNENFLAPILISYPNLSIYYDSGYTSINSTNGSINVPYVILDQEYYKKIVDQFLALINKVLSPCLSKNSIINKLVE